MTRTYLVSYWSLFAFVLFAEMRSEAVKLLKAEYVLRAIREHKMQRALIFCRTKLDCDNLERYFVSLGGGQMPPPPIIFSWVLYQHKCMYLWVTCQQTNKKALAGPNAKPNAELSCVCLHADRRPDERKTNLDRFKVFATSHSHLKSKPSFYCSFILHFYKLRIFLCKINTKQASSFY